MFWMIILVVIGFFLAGKHLAKNILKNKSIIYLYVAIVFLGIGLIFATFVGQVFDKPVEWETRIYPLAPFKEKLYQKYVEKIDKDIKFQYETFYDSTQTLKVNSKQCSLIETDLKHGFVVIKDPVLKIHFFYANGIRQPRYQIFYPKPPLSI